MIPTGFTLPLASWKPGPFPGIFSDSFTITFMIIWLRCLQEVRRFTTLEGHACPASSFYLGARMEFLIDLAQSLVGDVRVNLRSSYIAMAEHHLNRAKVGPIFDQVRCKAVPQ